MGKTFSDTDKEIEQKHIKIEFLGNKKGIPDSKIIEELNKFNLNNLSTQEKNDKFIKRLNKSLDIIKYIQN